MRRRLPTGSLFPLGAVLSIVAAAAWVVLPTVQEAPATPDVSVGETPLTPPDVPVAAGWETSAATDAELVGLRWEGDPAAEFSVVGHLADGTTTEAFEAPSLVQEGHLPDPDTAEGARAAAVGSNVTDAVWLGPDVVSVEVVLEEGTSTDVELTEVTSPTAAAPPGSAAAAGGPFGAFDGVPRTLATIAFLVGVGLLAAGVVALRARHRRRLGRLATVSLLVLGVGLGSTLVAGCTPDKPPIIKRAQWGADESKRNCAPDYNRRLQLGVIHHTAGAQITSPDQSAAQIRGIYAYHTDSLEYCDIAYNFLVDPFGQVFEGRAGGVGKIVQGAHSLHYNRRSVGIAVLGNYDPPSGGKSFVEDNVIWRYQDIIAWKFAKHGTGDPRERFTYKNAEGVKDTLKRVTTHKNVYPTACPGKPIRNRMNEVRDGAALKMGL